LPNISQRIKPAQAAVSKRRVRYRRAGADAEDALRGIETGMIVDGKTIMLLYHVALKGIL
jgi:hypothetical protein